MVAAVRQEATSTWDAAASLTVATPALALPCLSGSLIELYLIWGGSGTLPSSVVDSASQSYTRRGSSVFDNNDSLYMTLYTFANNQSNTTLSGLATWAATRTYRGLWIKELTGVTAAPFQVAGGQDQVNPGTTADAISSGLLTPTGQPALLSAVSFGDGGNAPMVAGTGFTAGITGWHLTGATADSSGSESKRITSLSQVAATATNSTDGGTRRFMTLAALYSEATAGSVLGGRWREGGMQELAA